MDRFLLERLQQQLMWGPTVSPLQFICRMRVALMLSLRTEMLALRHTCWPYIIRKDASHDILARGFLWCFLEHLENPKSDFHRLEDEGSQGVEGASIFR